MRDLFLFFFSVTWIQGQCTISLFVSIPMTTYFGVLYSPKPHLTLIKLAASGSLLLCNVCSHGPTAHTKPSTHKPPFLCEGRVMDTKRFANESLLPSCPKLNFLSYIFTNPLPMTPCLALPQLLQLFSRPQYPCLRLSLLSFSPCCISPCPQPLIHTSYLWPSGWEQVEKQVIIEIFMSGSLCLEIFPGGVVTLRKSYKKKPQIPKYTYKSTERHISFAWPPKQRVPLNNQ